MFGCCSNVPTQAYSCITFIEQANRSLKYAKNENTFSKNLGLHVVIHLRRTLTALPKTTFANWLYFRWKLDASNKLSHVDKEANKSVVFRTTKTKAYTPALQWTECEVTTASREWDEPEEAVRGIRLRKTGWWSELPGFAAFRLHALVLNMSTRIVKT